MSCVGARARRQRAARGRRRTALRRGAVTRKVRNRLTGRSHPRQNPRGGGRVRGRHRGGPRAPCRMRTVCFRNRIKRTLLKRQRPPDSAHAMPDTGHVPAQPRRGWLWGSGQVPALLGPVCRPCREWASPGPPWAGGVPRLHRPGLHWALTKPSPKAAAAPRPSARALWLSPALPGALET